MLVIARIYLPDEDILESFAENSVHKQKNKIELKRKQMRITMMLKARLK